MGLDGDSTTITAPLERALPWLERSALGGLPEPTRKSLLHGAKIERFPRRLRITQQGQPVQALFILGEGRVKLERAGQGHVFPLGHRGPGDLVGESAILGSAANEHAVVADEVSALVIPIASVRSLLAEDAVFRATMARALLALQQTTEARLTSLLLLGVRARLVEFLLGAVDRWATPHAAGTALAAPFTHADLASLVGSTRETITLELGKMRRAGLIELDKRRVVIRDRDALARYAVTT